MAEELSTKQKILVEALNLFAEKGYEAVSVGQIADAVGIKAPSLYKHYKSKQDIFDAILAEMDERYKQQANAMQLNGTNPTQDAKVYETISEDTLVEMGRNLFLYFLHDEYTAKFRKMLTVEQYHSKELADLYSRQYVDDVLSYQGMIFHLLSQVGILKDEKPKIMALQFYAPIYLLLTLCDRQPKREEECLNLLEEHIRQFNRFLGIR